MIAIVDVCGGNLRSVEKEFMAEFANASGGTDSIK